MSPKYLPEKSHDPWKSRKHEIKKGGYDHGKFLEKKLLPVIQGHENSDKRVISRFKVDKPDNKHFKWMKEYYPDVDAFASAEVTGCHSGCKMCWAPPQHKYPTREHLESVLKKSIQEHTYTGTEAVEKLYKMTKNINGNVVNRLTTGEPTITHQFFLDFIKATREKKRGLSIETNGIELGRNPEFAEKVKKELSKFPKKSLSLSTHILAGSPEAMLHTSGLKPEAMDHNLKGIKELDSLGYEHHIIFLAFIPHELLDLTEKELKNGEKRLAAKEKTQEKVLNTFKKKLEEHGLDPHKIEIRPVKPFRVSMQSLKEKAPTMSRKDFTEDFDVTVRLWKQLNPGYELPYRK
jgi:uncharacterized Fe-S cluster-containing radical SAM superfamily protein